MEKVKIKNVCLNCFWELGPDRICPNCKRRAIETGLGHHLPVRSILDKKYLIGNVIGEGGFGITYCAWNLQTTTKVAIKEYFPSGNVSRDSKHFQVISNKGPQRIAFEKGLKRFIDETKVLIKFNNLPGIVSIEDFIIANGTAYIVMEFLEGCSLKDYIKKSGGRISFDRALKLLTPIMEALIQVHNAGLVHRDISPDNIIITKTGHIKLIDFGAAKSMNQDGKSLSVILKPGYAPEEQYRRTGVQGPWTDVYALGVTLYRCVMGKVPPESIERIVDDKIIQPITSDKVQITKEQNDALMKALAVSANDRFRDVQSLLSALTGKEIEAQGQIKTRRIGTVTQREILGKVVSPATMAKRKILEKKKKKAEFFRSDKYATLIVSSVGIAFIALAVILSFFI